MIPTFPLVSKDIDVNQNDRLFNITLIHIHKNMTNKKQ